MQESVRPLTASYLIAPKEKLLRKRLVLVCKTCLHCMFFQYIVMEWLNNNTKRILIISSQTSGYLVPALGFPTQLKGKSCYFVKKHLVDLSVENMLTVIMKIIGKSF